MNGTRGLSARHQRAGFTLVELIVALVLGVIVLLGARMILEQLADSADHTSSAAINADRHANTERATRALFARATAADSMFPFVGTSRMAQFSSWCNVPRGWMERCTVTIAVIPQTAGDSLPTMVQSVALGKSTALSRVALWTSAGDTLHWRDSVTAPELRYLDDPSDGGHWLVGWPGGITTPLALGIVTPHDTTIFRIGERR